MLHISAVAAVRAEFVIFAFVGELADNFNYSNNYKVSHRKQNVRQYSCHENYCWPRQGRVVDPVFPVGWFDNRAKFDRIVPKNFVDASATPLGM